MNREIVPKVTGTDHAIEQAVDRVVKRKERTARKHFLRILRDLQSAFDDHRAKSRKKLADELRRSRVTLRELKQKIRNLDAEIQRAYCAKLAEASAVQAAVSHKLTSQKDYPEIPPPIFEPSDTGVGLPDVPGIYFLLLKGAIDYVGKSKRLSQRLKIGKHHVLHPAHLISFLPFDQCELTWIECYYIGITRPRKNFCMDEADLTETSRCAL